MRFETVAVHAGAEPDPATGAVLLWEMNGTTYVSSTIMNAGGTLWKVKGPR